MNSLKYFSIAFAMLMLVSFSSSEKVDTDKVPHVGPLATWMFPVDNLVLINFSTLLLQAAHTLAILPGDGDVFEFPEFKFQFTDEKCIFLFCQTYQDDISLGHIKVPKGFNIFDADIQLDSKVISYYTSIPSVTVRSEDFLWTKTNLNSSASTKLSELEVTVADVAFSFNAPLQENLKSPGTFSVGTVDINMNLGELRVRVPKVVRTGSGGKETVLPGINVNLAPVLNAVWKSSEGRYEAFVQAQLNCFLTHSRTGESCNVDASLLTDVTPQQAVKKLFSLLQV